MKTSSAKSKGRNLQKLVRDSLLSVAETLHPDDVCSTAMGQSGVDIQLSPAARQELGDLAIECKNRQTLSVPTTFFDHAKKYPNSMPLLVHKRNFEEPLITLKLNDFMTIYLKAWVSLAD